MGTYVLVALGSMILYFAIQLGNHSVSISVRLRYAFAFRGPAPISTGNTCEIGHSISQGSLVFLCWFLPQFIVPFALTTWNKYVYVDGHSILPALASFSFIFHPEPLCGRHAILPALRDEGAYGGGRGVSISRLKIMARNDKWP